MNSTQKINYINIGLMLFSAIAAMILPFEVFLFAYAFLGPLHYLTEISWLHDRNYYTKGKYDAIVLLGVGLLLLAAQLDRQFEQLGLGLAGNNDILNRGIYIAFLSSIILVFVKNRWYKILGVALVCITMYVADHWILFISVFLPTLVHVFVFTALFLLYGALKSRSITGIISFVVMLLCPVLLFTIMPDKIFIPITSYGLGAYKNFELLNQISLFKFFNIQRPDEQQIYFSSTGIVLMRFIAYAYTYHYLNWFSKTQIIKWHEVPKSRFAIVILLWLFSIALYLKDYKLGFEWLYFLSFLHVLLEFPLNFISITGIYKELNNIISIPKK
ncbi:MAG: hypothetical protein RL708_514 [Bacteroidota bacterium]|jgi:hypothetical protein